MTTLGVKQHDSGRRMTDVLRDTAGPIDLTNAVGVKLLARNAVSLAVKVNAACTFTASSAGSVAYVWTAADLDTAGSLQFEYQITYSDGSIYTVPSRKYHRLVITADVAQ